MAVCPDFSIPAPFFYVNTFYDILYQSEDAKRIFGEHANFFSLIDVESRRKFQRLAERRIEPQKFELLLNTVQSPAMLFDIHLKWNRDNHCSILCIEQSQRYQQITEVLTRFTQRLGMTNYDLLRRKEELERLLANLQQSNAQNDRLAELGRIAASIAHEIRNPLTSIRGLVQLLAPNLTSSAKLSYIDIIISEINRVNSIITEFLKTAKPAPPLKEAIPVTDLFAELELLCHSESLLQGIELVILPVDPSLMIYADRLQMKQVLLNMLHNAMEAISDLPNSRTGMIQFEAERFGRYVQIRIEDNGVGMDEQTRTHLFSPFFTTKNSGTGLGLSTCYHIVELHGGTIDVESTPGLGTVFRIYLPTVDKKPELS